MWLLMGWEVIIKTQSNDPSFGCESRGQFNKYTALSFIGCITQIFQIVVKCNIHGLFFFYV